MRFVGLTGGIASGKSTVAAMLRELGAPVIDADALARRAVEPGTPAYQEIVREFGAQLVARDGTIDRKALGDLVFADETRRKRLNAITHPRIAALAQEEAARLAQAGAKVAVYEAALLVENRIHEQLDGLIVVSAPEDFQLRRLRERDGLDAEAARLRLAAQLPLADKIAVATWVIDNAGSKEHTRAQVARLWEDLQRT